MEELLEQFDLSRVQKSGAIFDAEKLDWLQGQWIRRIPQEGFAARIRPGVEAAHPAAKNDPQFDHKAALIQERITFFSEAPDMLSYFYTEPHVTTELLANKKQKVTEEMLPEIFDALITTLEGMRDWSEESLKAALTKTMEKHGWSLGQILWPLRATLTGKEYSPGAFEVAAVLGKTKTIERLKSAVRLA